MVVSLSSLLFDYILSTASKDFVITYKQRSIVMLNFQCLPSTVCQCQRSKSAAQSLVSRLSETLHSESWANIGYIQECSRIGIRYLAHKSCGYETFLIKPEFFAHNTIYKGLFRRLVYHLA